MARRAACVAAFGAVAMMTSVASSAQSPPPTLAAATPEIAADPRPLGDERKFFIFHRADTSLDEARRDLAFCMRYAQTGAGVVLPYFVSWQGEGPGKAASYDGGQFGLVGSLIGAMIAGGLERSKRQMNLMHCMLPRGYGRYRVSDGLWKELNSKDLPASIDVQSRLASGPVPVTPKVLP